MTNALTKEEIIERAKNLRNDSDPTNIRLVVCKFFGDKCCSNTGEGSCEDDANVLECKATYLERIFDKPQEEWTSDWETPITREKKNIEEVIAIGVQCNNCHISDSCPEYRKNHSCSIEWAKKDFSEMTPEQMVDYLIAMQQERVARAQKFELIDGGVPDTNLSLEMDRLSGLIAQKNEMRGARFSLNISGSANSSQGSGLLSQLLGSMGKKGEDKAEAPPVEEQKVISVKSVDTLEFSEEVIEGRPISRKERMKKEEEDRETQEIAAPKSKTKSKKK